MFIQNEITLSFQETPEKDGQDKLLSEGRVNALGSALGFFFAQLFPLGELFSPTTLTFDFLSL